MAMLVFLFAQDGIGKHNKMFRYFLFTLYHITKLQLSNKNISKHTRLKFQFLPWSKSKVQVFFEVFLHNALYKNETKRCCKILHV